MQLNFFYFNELRVCTYILWDETKDCIIIDPGCGSGSERQRLLKFISDNSLHPVMTVNTHAHFDHVMGNMFVTKTFNIPTAIHEADVEMLDNAEQHSALFGIMIDQPPAATIMLSEKRTVHFGNSQLQTLHTPGHTPGGVCLYSATDKFVLTGDTLFQESIGRTDLPGGNYDDLMNSIKTKLMTLPGDVKVFPGHGLATSISAEMQNNPFIQL